MERNSIEMSGELDKPYNEVSLTFGKFLRDEIHLNGVVLDDEDRVDWMNTPEEVANRAEEYREVFYEWLPHERIKLKKKKD